MEEAKRMEICVFSIDEKQKNRSTINRYMYYMRTVSKMRDAVDDFVAGERIQDATIMYRMYKDGEQWFTVAIKDGKMGESKEGWLADDHV